jgi:hypothetical protein
MDDQHLGIADVGQMGDELDAVDEFLLGCNAGF